MCSGTGRVAVCAGVGHPLSVRLHLHCAPGDAVGVEHQVARLGLHVLPLTATRGHWKHTRHRGNTYLMNDLNP